jgi:hypothetical protein
MTSYLILTRITIIPVMPAALTFDAIEFELERRGIEL